MQRFFYHSMFPISPSFGASRKLHFVLVALPGYLHICITDINEQTQEMLQSRCTAFLRHRGNKETHTTHKQPTYEQRRIAKGVPS